MKQNQEESTLTVKSAQPSSLTGLTIQRLNLFLPIFKKEEE